MRQVILNKNPGDIKGSTLRASLLTRLSHFCFPKLTKLHPSPLKSGTSSRSAAHSKFLSNNSPSNVDHLQAQRPYSHRVKNFVTKEASKLFQDFREKCLFPTLFLLNHQTRLEWSEHFQTKMKNEEEET